MFANQEYNYYIETTINKIVDKESLKNTKILIAGATGMLGVVLVDCLMELNLRYHLNIHVIALGRNKEYSEKLFSQYQEEPNYEFVECDINEKIPEIGDIDYIIHAASNTHPVAYSTDPVGTITTNVIGTYHLLELAKNKMRKRFVFLSSVEIYGVSEKETFSEEDCGYIDCNTVRAGYPESKRVGESLCCAYRKKYEMDVVIPRLCRIYGPTMRPDDSKALSQFIRKIVKNEDIVLKSEGKQYYSYLHVIDAVSAIFLILLKGETGEAYNVSSALSNVSLWELAEKLAFLGRVNIKREKPEKIEEQGYSKAVRAVLNNDKLKRLGWEEIFDIDSGLKMTVNVLRNLEKI